MLARDFFTVETATLKTLYVLFFIELGIRQVHMSGCAQHPGSSWVAQQARQLCWGLESRAVPMCFLIHDNDSKFTVGLDAVFQSTGVEVIHTPLHGPNTNAIAERFVRTVRQECLDQLVILNERHLRRALRDYVDFYNTQRPHQGLARNIQFRSDFLPNRGRFSAEMCWKASSTTIGAPRNLVCVNFSTIRAYP